MYHLPFSILTSRQGCTYRKLSAHKINQNISLHYNPFTNKLHQIIHAGSFRFKGFNLLLSVSVIENEKHFYWTQRIEKGGIFVDHYGYRFIFDDKHQYVDPKTGTWSYNPKNRTLTNLLSGTVKSFDKQGRLIKITNSQQMDIQFIYKSNKLVAIQDETARLVIKHGINDSYVLKNKQEKLLEVTASKINWDDDHITIAENMYEYFCGLRISISKHGFNIGEEQYKIKKAGTKIILQNGREDQFKLALSKDKLTHFSSESLHLKFEGQNCFEGDSDHDEPQYQMELDPIYGLPKRIQVDGVLKEISYQKLKLDSDTSATLITTQIAKKKSYQVLLNGRVIVSVSAEGRVKTYQYGDQENRIKHYIDPISINNKSFTMSLLRELLRDKECEVEIQKVNNKGLVEQVEKAKDSMSLQYDLSGNVSLIHGLEKVARRFDKVGRITAENDSRSKFLRFKRHTVLMSNKNLYGITGVGIDWAGRQVSLFDNGKRYSFKLDKAGFPYATESLHGTFVIECNELGFEIRRNNDEYEKVYQFDKKGNQLSIKHTVNSKEYFSQNIFNINNQCIYKISEQGVVTAIEYDSQGNISKKTTYDEKIDNSKCITAELLDKWTHDKSYLCKSWIYDADDLPIVTVDKKGLVTIHDYDGLGRISSSLKLSEAHLDESIKLEEFISKQQAHKDNRKHRYVYINQKDYIEIDPEGYLSAVTHNAKGQVESIKHFQDKYSLEDFNLDMLQIWIELKEKNKAYESILYIRDDYNRIVEETHSNGLKILNQYLGKSTKLISKTTFGHGVKTQRELWQYDNYGREIQHLNAKQVHYLALDETDYKDIDWQAHRFNRRGKEQLITEMGLRVSYNKKGLKKSVKHGKIQCIIHDSEADKDIITEVDEIEYRYYDDKGRLSYTLSHDGILIGYQYTEPCKKPTKVSIFKDYVAQKIIQESDSGSLPKKLKKWISAKDSYDTYYEYDTKERPILEIDHLGLRTIQQWDAHDQLELQKVEISKGKFECEKWKYKKTQNKKICAHYIEQNEKQTNVFTTKECFSAFGEVTALEDGNKNISSFKRNKRGKALETLLPDGTRRIKAFDYKNRCKEQYNVFRGKKINTHATKYLDRDNVEEHTNAYGIKTKVHKNTFAQEVRVENEKGYIRATQYNRLNQASKKFSGDDELHLLERSRHRYNARGLKNEDQFNHSDFRRAFYQMFQGKKTQIIDSGSSTYRLDLCHDTLKRLKEEYITSKENLYHTKHQYDGMQQATIKAAGKLNIKKIEKTNKKHQVESVSYQGDEIHGNEVLAQDFIEVYGFDIFHNQILQQQKNGKKSRTLSHCLSDNCGNIISKTNALGKTENYFYDNMNRIRFKLEQDGSLTEWKYQPPYSKPIIMSEYHARLTHNDKTLSRRELLTMIDKHCAGTPARLTQFEYDDNDAIRKKVFQGITTEYSRDVFGKIMAEVSYRRPDGKKRSTLTIRNKRGAPEFTVDENSYITQFIYDDKFPEKPKRITKYSAQLILKRNLLECSEDCLRKHIDACIKDSSQEKQESLYFYADDGKKVFELDEHGVITRYSYDSVRDLEKVQRVALYDAAHCLDKAKAMIAEMHQWPGMVKSEILSKSHLEILFKSKSAKARSVELHRDAARRINAKTIDGVHYQWKLGIKDDILQEYIDEQLKTDFVFDCYYRQYQKIKRELLIGDVSLNQDKLLKLEVGLKNLIEQMEYHVDDSLSSKKMLIDEGSKLLEHIEYSKKETTQTKIQKQVKLALDDGSKLRPEKIPNKSASHKVRKKTKSQKSDLSLAASREDFPISSINTCKLDFFRGMDSYKTETSDDDIFKLHFDGVELSSMSEMDSDELIEGSKKLPFDGESSTTEEYNFTFDTSKDTDFSSFDFLSATEEDSKSLLQKRVKKQSQERQNKFITHDLVNSTVSLSFNRVFIKINTNGDKAFTLYDNEYRKIFEIDEEGHVEAFEYESFEYASKRIKYDLKLEMPRMEEVGSLSDYHDQLRSFCKKAVVKAKARVYQNVYDGSNTLITKDHPVDSYVLFDKHERVNLVEGYARFKIDKLFSQITRSNQLLSAKSGAVLESHDAVTKAFAFPNAELSINKNGYATLKVFGLSEVPELKWKLLKKIDDRDGLLKLSFLELITFFHKYRSRKDILEQSEFDNQKRIQQKVIFDFDYNEGHGDKYCDVISNYTYYPIKGSNIYWQKETIVRRNSSGALIKGATMEIFNLYHGDLLVATIGPVMHKSAVDTEEVCMPGVVNIPDYQSENTAVIHFGDIALNAKGFPVLNKNFLPNVKNSEEKEKLFLKNSQAQVLIEQAANGFQKFSGYYRNGFLSKLWHYQSYLPKGAKALSEIQLIKHEKYFVRDRVGQLLEIYTSIETDVINQIIENASKKMSLSRTELLASLQKAYLGALARHAKHIGISQGAFTKESYVRNNFGEVLSKIIGGFEFAPVTKQFNYIEQHEFDRTYGDNGAVRTENGKTIVTGLNHKKGLILGSQKRSISAHGYEDLKKLLKEYQTQIQLGTSDSIWSELIRYDAMDNVIFKKDKEFISHSTSTENLALIMRINQTSIEWDDIYDENYRVDVQIFPKVGGLRTQLRYKDVKPIERKGKLIRRIELDRDKILPGEYYYEVRYHHKSTKNNHDAYVFSGEFSLEEPSKNFSAKLIDHSTLQISNQEKYKYIQLEDFNGNKSLITLDYHDTDKYLSTARLNRKALSASPIEVSSILKAIKQQGGKKRLEPFFSEAQLYLEFSVGHSGDSDWMLFSTSGLIPSFIDLAKLLAKVRLAYSNNQIKTYYFKPNVTYWEYAKLIDLDASKPSNQYQLYSAELVYKYGKDEFVLASCQTNQGGYNKMFSKKMDVNSSYDIYFKTNDEYVAICIKDSFVSFVKSDFVAKGKIGESDLRVVKDFDIGLNPEYLTYHSVNSEELNLNPIKVKLLSKLNVKEVVLSEFEIINAAAPLKASYRYPWVKIQGLQDKAFKYRIVLDSGKHIFSGLVPFSRKNYIHHGKQTSGLWTVASPRIGVGHYTSKDYTVEVQLDNGDWAPFRAVNAEAGLPVKQSMHVISNLPTSVDEIELQVWVGDRWILQNVSVNNGMASVILQGPKGALLTIGDYPYQMKLVAKKEVIDVIEDAFYIRQGHLGYVASQRNSQIVQSPISRFAYDYLGRQSLKKTGEHEVTLSYYKNSELYETQEPEQTVLVTETDYERIAKVMQSLQVGFSSQNIYTSEKEVQSSGSGGYELPKGWQLLTMRPKSKRLQDSTGTTVGTIDKNGVAHLEKRNEHGYVLQTSDHRGEPIFFSLNSFGKWLQVFSQDSSKKGKYKQLQNRKLDKDGLPTHISGYQLIRNQQKQTIGYMKDGQLISRGDVIDDMFSYVKNNQGIYELQLKDFSGNPLLKLYESGHGLQITLFDAMNRLQQQFRMDETVETRDYDKWATQAKLIYVDSKVSEIREINAADLVIKNISLKDNQSQYFRHNAMRQMISSFVRDIQSGLTIEDQHITRSWKGDVLVVADQQLLLEQYQDLMGRTAKYKYCFKSRDKAGFQWVEQDAYNLFNKLGRVLLAKGSITKDGKLILLPGKGIVFEYQQDAVMQKALTLKGEETQAVVKPDGEHIQLAKTVNGKDVESVQWLKDKYNNLVREDIHQELVKDKDKLKLKKHQTDTRRISQDTLQKTIVPVYINDDDQRKLSSRVQKIQSKIDSETQELIVQDISDNPLEEGDDENRFVQSVLKTKHRFFGNQRFPVKKHCHVTETIKQKHRSTKRSTKIDDLEFEQLPGRLITTQTGKNPNQVIFGPSGPILKVEASTRTLYLNVEGRNYGIFKEQDKQFEAADGFKLFSRHDFPFETNLHWVQPGENLSSIMSQYGLPDSYGTDLLRANHMSMGELSPGMPLKIPMYMRVNLAGLFKLSSAPTALSEILQLMPEQEPFYHKPPSRNASRVRNLNYLAMAASALTAIATAGMSLSVSSTVLIAVLENVATQLITQSGSHGFDLDPKAMFASAAIAFVGGSSDLVMKHLGKMVDPGFQMATQVGYNASVTIFANSLQGKDLISEQDFISKMANVALSSIDRGKSVASKLGRAALETSIDVGLERLLSKEHSNTLDVFAKTLSRFAHHYASLTQSDVRQAKAREALELSLESIPEPEHPVHERHRNGDAYELIASSERYTRASHEKAKQIRIKQDSLFEHPKGGHDASHSKELTEKHNQDYSVFHGGVPYRREYLYKNELFDAFSDFRGLSWERRTVGRYSHDYPAMQIKAVDIPASIFDIRSQPKVLSHVPDFFKRHDLMKESTVFRSLVHLAEFSTRYTKPFVEGVFDADPFQTYRKFQRRIGATDDTNYNSRLYRFSKYGAIIVEANYGVSFGIYIWSLDRNIKSAMMVQSVFGSLSNGYASAVEGGSNGDILRASIFGGIVGGFTGVNKLSLYEKAKYTIYGNLGAQGFGYLTDKAATFSLKEAFIAGLVSVPANASGDWFMKIVSAESAASKLIVETSHAIKAAIIPELYLAPRAFERRIAEHEASYRSSM